MLVTPDGEWNQLMRKDDFPKAIADILGIPPEDGIAGPWMSSEGTVLAAWLHAVGEALDIPYAGEKTRMMRSLVESVGASWDPGTMASKLTPSGGGGNISTPAFEALFRGLQNQPVAQRRVQSNQNRGPFEWESAPSQRDDLLAMRAIRIRAGQPKFRSMLLEAYKGRCAVTGTDAAAALEAAHVVPYGTGGTYEVTNGLLLRADIHTMFDLGLIGFDDQRELIVHKELRLTTYAGLVGTRLAEPSPASKRVPDAALESHRRSVHLVT